MNLDSIWFMLQKLVRAPLTTNTAALIQHLYLSVPEGDVHTLLDMLMHQHLGRPTLFTILPMIVAREMRQVELDFRYLVDKLIRSYIEYRLDMPYLLDNIDIIMSYVPNIGTEEMLLYACKQNPPCTALIQMLRCNGVNVAHVLQWAREQGHSGIISLLSEAQHFQKAIEMTPAKDDDVWLNYLRHLFTTNTDVHTTAYCPCDTNYNYILMRCSTSDHKSSLQTQAVGNAFTPISRKRSRAARNCIMKEQITQKTRDYQNTVDPFSQDHISDIPSLLLISITQDNSTYGFDLGHLYKYLTMSKDKCNPFNKTTFCDSDLARCHETFQKLKEIMCHVPLCRQHVV